MTSCVPTIWEAITTPPTSKSNTSTFGTVSHERAPTDPFFYADVVLINARCGSRYLLGWYDNGVFTEFSPTFEGTVPGTEGDVANVTLSNVPSYEVSMVLAARIRKSSTGTKYAPLTLLGVHGLGGTNLYASQVVDGVAT